MKNEHLRKWHAYQKEMERLVKVFVDSGHDPSMAPASHLPEELRNMTCEAKTRAGTPCKITALYENGRCKFHGGLSTGPKTEAGKMKASRNGLKKKRRRG